MDTSIMNNLYAGDFFPALNSNESPEKVLFLKQKEEQKQTKSLFRQWHCIWQGYLLLLYFN